MSDFADWLARVLSDGESVQDAPPDLPAVGRPAALDVLRAAFDRHALDVAGPPVPFDPDAATRAALTLARACWRLVAADDPRPVPLDPGPEPRTPAAHLSADVCLRLLPTVRRRAALRGPDDPLVQELDRVIRAWPLSGVRCDLDGRPTTPPDFAGHPGLCQLYAERLARTPRPGWVPPAGPARDWVERLFADRRLPLPSLPLEPAPTDD